LLFLCVKLLKFFNKHYKELSGKRQDGTFEGKTSGEVLIIFVILFLLTFLEDTTSTQKNAPYSPKIATIMATLERVNTQMAYMQT